MRKEFPVQLEDMLSGTSNIFAGGLIFIRVFSPRPLSLKQAEHKNNKGSNP
jgi:hypothetical protein